MKTQTYHRLVHGQSHVRDLFCNVIEEAAYHCHRAKDPVRDALKNPALAEQFSHDKDRAEWEAMKPAERKRWLRGKLWFCSSIIPSAYRELLTDLLDEPRKLFTYARAVRSELFS